MLLLCCVLALSMALGLEYGQVVINASLSFIPYYIYVAKGKVKDMSGEKEGEV